MSALATAIDGRRDGLAAERLPTLTEVVELGQPIPAITADEWVSSAVVAQPPEADLPPPADPPRLLPDMMQLSAAVLAELQPRIELLFEARLREALAPALARAADGLIRDTREQLSDTLQALVQEVVARVLEQRRAD